MSDFEKFPLVHEKKNKLRFQTVVAWGKKRKNRRHIRGSLKQPQDKEKLFTMGGGDQKRP